ncbi:MAG: GGDEF domain-containing protein [Gemmatimonadaceae bacterium]
MPAKMSPETSLVLDTLGAVLQLYGKHAFDTDTAGAADTRNLVHAWMLHATMGATRPGSSEERPAGGVLYRDWKGLVQYFGGTRRDEAAYVTRALGDFRDSIWAFVSALHQLVLEEQEEGRIATEHFTRVKAAVTSNSTEQLKRETIAAISVMENLMVARRERQQRQFTVLADKLKSLGRELEDARRESALDPLTRLPNRRSFDDYITRSIELHSLLGQPACLMMVDVDNFKQINDAFGHPVGDEALRQVARALSRTFLRRVDYVCRYGGDEFAVILQETSHDGATALGEKLRRAMREVLAAQQGSEPKLECTLSVGIAELQLGDDAMSWTQRADAALYTAKRAGRDQVAHLAAAP